LIDLPQDLTSDQGARPFLFSLPNMEWTEEADLLLLQQYEENFRSKVKEYKKRLNNPKLTAKIIRERIEFLLKVQKGKLKHEDW
jgi:hypothetical protein